MGTEVMNDMHTPRASFWARPLQGGPEAPPPAETRVARWLLMTLRLLGSFNNLLLPPLATLMVIEAVASPEAGARVSSDQFMLWFCLFFGGEWLLGCALARSKRAYLWNFWLLADLLSSVPFNWLFQTGRLVRFARVSRVLRLGRYRKLSRMARLARFTRLRLDLSRAAKAIGMVLTLALSGALALRVAEPQVVDSLLDAVWWAVVTITAVGYGDIVPATPVGRLVGMGLILASLAVFGYAAALASSSLDQEDKLGKQQEVLAAIEASEQRTAERLRDLEATLARLAASDEA